MLAGYLPFDDDPANPEGDNINLLYKYIVSTPLTFPEYVTPHARDLLKRILVPDPRKRADLFEVARHSWLSDYAHVVSFITSNTTASTDAQKAAAPASRYSVVLLFVHANPTQKNPSMLLRLREAHLFASPSSHILPLLLLVGLRLSGNKSTETSSLKSPKPAAITSAERCKWSMLRHNRRPLAERRPHPRLLQERLKHVLRIKVQPKYPLWMVINLQVIHASHGRPPPTLPRLLRLGLRGKLRDPPRIIRHSAPFLQQQRIDLPLVVPLGRVCHRGEIHMVSPQLPQSLKQMPKAAFHNQRANSTLFQAHYLSLTLKWASLQLVSRALNRYQQSRPMHKEQITKGTSGRIRLVRPLGE